jgi:dethiobiotin synthetase
MQGLLITGTDTGVGKTFVAARIGGRLRSLGVRVGLYKPVCSGAVWNVQKQSWSWPDVDILSATLDHSFPGELICPQRFQASLAPPEAARLEGRPVDVRQLRTGAIAWAELCEVLLVEGVGGWKCPLTELETMADLSCDLGFPVLVVAANRLGVINHTLLTVESIQQAGLPVAGVLLNDVADQADESTASNAIVLERMLDVPLLGRIPFQQRGASVSGALREIDWFKLCGRGLSAEQD